MLCVHNAAHPLRLYIRQCLDLLLNYYDGILQILQEGILQTLKDEYLEMLTRQEDAEATILPRVQRLESMSCYHFLLVPFT